MQIDTIEEHYLILNAIYLQSFNIKIHEQLFIFKQLSDHFQRGMYVQFQTQTNFLLMRKLVITSC